MNLIARSGDVDTNQIELIRIDSESNEFTHYVKDGKLYIEGSNDIALARGYYDYIKEHGYGLFAWSGSNISLPKNPIVGEKKHVVSPFDNHYYFNVVTYGYTMPYWDWNRWEKEIDWMALHGINMPLALVGYESIMARVWKKMGLTDEEINNYFVAPAHLPWMRMGNISNSGGPLNHEWYDDQVALQHKILDRMLSLGMKPITMGFPGFVPEAFKRLYPDLELVETHWAGAFNNWMVSPEHELYSEIAKAYMTEWQKEFGKSDYYLVDSFNEMEIPFPPKESQERYDLLTSYGEIVYDAIKEVNPDATWVMQGWMFGYSRDIWDVKTLQALTSPVPDDKMILLDLAVDYNKHFWHTEVNWDYHKGFDGKQWVYSVIPNMGGKSSYTGVLDFYANGHLEALASPNRGNLIAHGSAPEGIENNEIIYELYTDAGWSDKEIDVEKWYEGYAKNRYGKFNPKLTAYIRAMRSSVYGSFTDHPRFNWQFRPGRVKNGSVNINEDFFWAGSIFAEAAAQFEDSEMYEIDLIENSALHLGGKAEILINLIEQEYLIGNKEKAESYEKLFEEVMLAMDALLRNHPTLNMTQWLDYAERSGSTAELKKQYLTDAKRLITIWGPPIDDYSARVWGGLIGEYYLPRWKHYFDSKKSGEPFDFTAWEIDWVENHVHDRSIPEINVVELAQSAMESVKDIHSSMVVSDNNILGYWSAKDGEETEVTLQLSAAALKGVKSIEVKPIGNIRLLTLSSCKILADGKVVYSNHADKSMRLGDSGILYDISSLSSLSANNGLVLNVKLCSAFHDASGYIKFNR